MIRKVLFFFIIAISFNSFALAADKAVVSVVKGSSIEAAVRKAVELVGGMEGRIKKWDRVLIKVSLDEAKPSGSGEVTNVEVVRALVHMCKEAGARRVTIADGSIKANTYRAFEAAGYNKMAKEEGVILKDLDSDYIWRAWLPDGDKYKKYSVATTVLNCEVFINVPVAKINDPTSPSLALKNLVGIMCDKRWKKRLKSGEELDGIIVDMNSIRQSDLVVIDATNNNNMVMAGNDTVSTDTIACKILKLNAGKINYLKMAADKGLGTDNLSEIDIKSENL